MGSKGGADNNSTELKSIACTELKKTLPVLVGAHKGGFCDGVQHETLSI